MKELRVKYNTVRSQALKLMQRGKISDYLKKLQEANELKTKMIRISSNQ